MIKEITLALIFIVLAAAGGSYSASYIHEVTAPEPVALDLGNSTVGSLDQWNGTTSPDVAITQRTYGKDVKLSGLNDGCLELSSSLITSSGSPCGTGSGSGSGLGTTTPWTVGQLAMVSSDAAVTGVSTTTLTASSPLSLSNPVFKVGGSNSVLTLDTSGTWTGNAGTASALAADPTDCSAGSFPLGINAAGTAQNCTDAFTQAENDAAAYFNDLADFTGTLTDGRICTYDLAGGEIDCDYVDIVGSGGTGIATSGPIADTEVIYATGVGTVDSEAAFTYNSSANRLSFDFASSTGWSSAYASSTVGVFGSLTALSSLTIGSDSIAEYIADTTGAMVSGNTESGITVAYQDADNTLDFTVSAGVANLASADFGDWTCNGSTCTVDANAIALGTDTTGNYVATLSSSGSITVANSGSETAAVTANLNMANANSWTALQTFANATSTLFSATYASTTDLLAGRTFSFGGVTGDSWDDFCVSITGDAGLCDSDDATGAGGAAAVATSTNETAGRLAYWTSTSGTPATLGEVATTTLTGGSQVAVSNSPVVIGSSGAVLSIVADSIGDTQLAFDTGQALTTASTPTFAGLTLTPLTSALLLTNGSGVLAEYAGTTCTNQVATALSALGAATCTTITSAYVDSSILTTSTAIDIDQVNGDTSNDDDLDVAAGGTGVSTLTGLVQGNGTSDFTAITNSSTAGQVLRVTGASTYAWGALDLADSDAITGVLPVANGGTGTTTRKVVGRTVASTSPAFISAGLMPLSTFGDAGTMVKISCKVDTGTSKVIAIEDASGNSSEDITCGTSYTYDDGSITNATFTADEEMYIDFGATTGSVDYVTINVFAQ